jgi:UDP-2,3-diacylglucosamine hydrolase
MFHNIQLQEGACIISDAHYSPDRPELLSLIKAIHAKEIQTPQLILMGDVFDALFGSINYTYKTNQEMIELINAIAQDTEVLYFEGNHDFNLKVVFQNVKIFPITVQPLLVSYKDKKIYLAHGDFDAPFGYQVYTALIRNPIVLFFLKYIDIALGHLIINKIEGHLDKKDDCKELTWFDDFIQKRFSNAYVCDYFIEGHFHQNKRLELKKFTYINLGAFACNQRYFIVKSIQDKELLEEHQFSKER